MGKTTLASHIVKIKTTHSTLYQFEYLLSKWNSLIEKYKLNYSTRASKKLSDLITSPKSYCSILKTFLNNKGIRCIPPLLNDDKVITNLKEKTEIFSNFLQSNFLLKAKIVIFLQFFQIKLKLLSTIHFKSDNILKID